MLRSRDSGTMWNGCIAFWQLGQAATSALPELERIHAGEPDAERKELLANVIRTVRNGDD
jgi:hypothetical protein